MSQLPGFGFFHLLIFLIIPLVLLVFLGFLFLIGFDEVLIFLVCFFVVCDQLSEEVGVFVGPVKVAEAYSHVVVGDKHLRGGVLRQNLGHLLILAAEMGQHRPPGLDPFN